MKKLFLLRNVSLVVGFLAITSLVSAQDTNPRFGKWKLKSDAPAPAQNIMTYEPYGDGGMRITIDAVNTNGEKRKWGYVTLFDGILRPVTGDSNTDDSAVVSLDEKNNYIMNRIGNRVNVIINVLSEDGNTINNEYHSVTENGEVRVSHAVYERFQ